MGHGPPNGFNVHNDFQNKEQHDESFSQGITAQNNAHIRFKKVIMRVQTTPVSSAD